jgi:predicted nucleic acid-binding protein
VIGEASLDEPVSRDPDDDNVLAAANAGRCEAIVTGDKDLLVLGEFAGIPILTPRQFFDSAGPGLSLNS